MQRAIGDILLDVDEDSGIAVITLNRPERRNAMNNALTSGILQGLDELRTNERIHCVMTKAAGGVAFCAGGDLFEIRDRRLHPEKYADQRPIGSTDVAQAFLSVPQATMAVVEGYCLGAGMTVIAGHDLVVAAETAEFGMPEVLRGTQSTNAAPLLAWHLPIKKLLFLTLSGRSIDAFEAERAGLVSKVVPKAELYVYAEALARDIGRHDLRALHLGKRLGYGVRGRSLEEGWEYGTQLAGAIEGGRDSFADLERYLRSQKRTSSS